MCIYRNSVVLSFLTLNFFVLTFADASHETKSTASSSASVDLEDGKWDQIQKGQWLVGFFDAESEDSQKLERDWEVFAVKCKEQNINAGKVFVPKNPGLYVRFLVTSFPKVLYIKNGVAHEVQHPNRNTLVQLIRDGKWGDLKSVGFMSNPFSIQMSLLSHLFVHAVTLYSFEDAIVQKFVPFKSATDIAFGLTFIVVGTFLGLLLACAFDVIQVIFMDSKDSGEEEEERKIIKAEKKIAKEKSDKETKEEVVSKDKSEDPVRKRK